LTEPPRLPAYGLAFFDVDSTLVTIEGVDVLANGNPEIASLTDAAMNGLIPLDEVYGRRLELIRPTRREVADLAERYRQSLVDGAAETIRRLREARVAVYLVTAGIEQAILPLAESLGLGARNVRAVRLRFDAAGDYIDFDRRSFLTRTGGKELVVRDIRARSHGRAVFVGDGVSDLEARPAVDLFVGFGGVRIRERVREEADLFIAEPSFASIGPLIIEGQRP
jgi:phosphoserine phosphatase